MARCDRGMARRGGSRRGRGKLAHQVLAPPARLTRSLKVADRSYSAEIKDERCMPSAWKRNNVGWLSETRAEGCVAAWRVDHGGTVAPEGSGQFKRAHASAPAR
eukprot:scaffold51904_cov63-Phaeocystis_antarctica.AAC.2